MADRLPAKPGPVPPPGPDDFLLPINSKLRVVDGRVSLVPDVLRLTPADQAFLTKLGIRWRY